MKLKVKIHCEFNSTWGVGMLTLTTKSCVLLSQISSSIMYVFIRRDVCLAHVFFTYVSFACVFAELS